MKENDILNKGVPIDIGSVPININTIINTSEFKDVLTSHFEQYSNEIFNYVNKFIKHKSRRHLRFKINLSIQYQKETKTNEIVFDPFSILYDFFDYLEINNIIDEKRQNCCDSFDIYQFVIDLIYKKCDELRKIVHESKLKKRFPKLYNIYLEEKSNYKLYTNFLKENKYNKKLLLSRLNQIYYNDDKLSIYEMNDTLKMNKVKNFCQLYSSIILDILNSHEDISVYFKKHPIEIDNDIFKKDDLEAYIVYRYILQINTTDDIVDKQKYLYYLTSYFNSNKDLINTNKIFNINNQEISFDLLYNEYIDILINNPELKVVNYERKDFDEYTFEEVEEYMELELKDSKGNWIFIDEELKDERIAKAIYNSTSKIKDKNKRKKKQDELKALFMEKKTLFENSRAYKTVEGINSFDGYLAYIYSNGKVILERYFEKRKDETEVIAIDQAIYVMNIEEFYSISRLSKSTIIKDKLCKRYYHKGDWKTKVISEINKSGTNPVEEYKKLVFTNKIKD